MFKRLQALVDHLDEILKYEGYTYQELCMAAGGGGGNDGGDTGGGNNDSISDRDGRMAEAVTAAGLGHVAATPNTPNGLGGFTLGQTYGDIAESYGQQQADAASRAALAAKGIHSIEDMATLSSYNTSVQSIVSGIVGYNVDDQASTAIGSLGYGGATEIGNTFGGYLGMSATPDFGISTTFGPSFGMVTDNYTGIDGRSYSVSYDAIGLDASYSVVSTDLDGNISTFGYDASSGISSYSGSSAQGLNGYSGYSVEEASMFGGYTTSFNSTFGWNYGMRSRSILGINVTYDVHFDAFGRELGLVDEAVADIMEALGIEVTAEVATTISGITSVIGAVAFGLPSTPVGMMATVSQVLGGIATIGYAQGLIGIDDYGQIAAVTGAIGLFAGLVNTMQTIDAITAARSYGMVSPIETFLGVAISLAQAVGQINSFANTMASLGITGTPTMADAMSYANGGGDGSGLELGKDSNYSAATYNKFLKWYKLYVDGQGKTLDVVNKDVFDYMAGGSLYDSQMAGSTLYHPNTMHNIKGCVDFRLNLDTFTKHSLFQENANYQQLLPLPVVKDTEVTTLGVVARGKLTRVNRLIDMRNEIVDEYNKLVDDYNNDVNIIQLDIDKYNAKVEAYNSAGKNVTSTLDVLDAENASLTKRVDDLAAAKETLVENLNNLSKEIEKLSEQINELLF